MDADQSRPAPVSISSWSFNRLIVYEACNLRAKMEYLVRRPYAENYNKEAANRGNLVHNGAERYIRGEGQLTNMLMEPNVIVRLNEYRAAFAEGKAVVEQEWGFNRDWEPTGWFADDVWQRAKCDVVVDHGDLIEIADWKTGKRDGNEIKHAQQGQLYAIDALFRYPKANVVRTRFIYTDEGKEKTQEHTRTAVMRTWPSWDQRARNMTSATAFPHKANKMTCRFCPYAPAVNGGDGSCPYGVEVPQASLKKSRRTAA